MSSSQLDSGVTPGSHQPVWERWHSTFPRFCPNGGLSRSLQFVKVWLSTVYFIVQPFPLETYHTRNNRMTSWVLFVFLAVSFKVYHILSRKLSLDGSHSISTATAAGQEEEWIQSHVMFGESSKSPEQLLSNWILKLWALKRCNVWIMYNANVSNHQEVFVLLGCQAPVT